MYDFLKALLRGLFAEDGFILEIVYLTDAFRFAFLI